MKKTVSILLAFALLLSLAACSSAPADTTPPVDDTPAADNRPAAPSPEEPVGEPDDGEDLINQPAAMPEEPAEEPSEDEMTVPEADPELVELMTSILTDVNLEMATDFEVIGNDRYWWYFGSETPVEGYAAYGCEPIIGSIPLSIALMKVPEGTDASVVATDLESTVNERKWVCVEAESKVVKQADQFILVVLADSSIAEAVETNFDTAFLG